MRGRIGRPMITIRTSIPKAEREAMGRSCPRCGALPNENCPTTTRNPHRERYLNAKKKQQLPLYPVTMAVVDVRDTITATELAGILGKDIAAVYRLAHRKGWRRTETRPVRYAIADVYNTTAEPAPTS